jgi:hypothetical protein
MRVVGAQLGAPAGHSVTQIDRSFSEPLRVELGAGELKTGCADYRVANGGGAGLQFKDAGGGDGFECGAE